MAPEEDWYLEDEGQLQHILQKEFVDELFGHQAKVNAENWELLNRSQKFLKKLESIRKRENIPELEAKSDIHVFEMEDELGNDFLDSRSKYLAYGNKNKRERINKAILNLIYSFELPLNFYDWILYLLLYRKRMEGSPRYNMERIYEIMDSSKEAKRLPISTLEKKFIRNQFRFIHRITGKRIPEEFLSDWKLLNRNLSLAPKNRKRRARLFGESLDSLETTSRYIQKDDATRQRKKRISDRMKYIEKKN